MSYHAGNVRKSHKNVLSILSLLITIAMLMLTACGDTGCPDSLTISQDYRVPEEKQLIVYTSHKEEVYLPIIMEFENRTGIWVEVHAGGTTEMFKEAREASKIGACDIMFGGGVESFEASKDLFMRYEPSEKDKIDEHYLSNGGFWTPFTEIPLVFVYNNKLVSEEEAPHTWTDLLQPKWSGQIAFADLHSSGTSYTALSAISQMMGDDSEKVLTSFIEGVKPHVLASSSEVIPDVSNGTFLVGITLEETAMKSMRAGADITMVYPEDGTAAPPDGCAMVKNAPHRYNAGVFIDFVTGYDTQKYAMDTFMRRPIRRDIPLSGDYEAIRKIDFNIEKSAREEKQIFALWDEIMNKGVS